MKSALAFTLALLAGLAAGLAYGWLVNPASYGNTSNHMANVRGGTAKNMAGTNAVVSEDGTVTPDPVTPVET